MNIDSRCLETRRTIHFNCHLRLRTNVSPPGRTWNPADKHLAVWGGTKRGQLLDRVWDNKLAIIRSACTTRFSNILSLVAVSPRTNGHTAKQVRGAGSPIGPDPYTLENSSRQSHMIGCLQICTASAEDESRIYKNPSPAPAVPVSKLLGFRDDHLVYSQGGSDPCIALAISLYFWGTCCERYKFSVHISQAFVLFLKAKKPP